MLIAAISDGSQPEWWQLLLQYGAGPVLVAIVSTVALVVQNHQNNEREDRRKRDDTDERQKDRADADKARVHGADEAAAERSHQRELTEIDRDARLEELRLTQDHERGARAATRAANLEDAWRGERREAHQALLPTFESGMKKIEDAFRQISFDDGKVNVPATAISALGYEFKAEMAKAVAAVVIVGSEASRHAAEACHARLSSTDVELWAATHPTYGANVRANETALWKHVQESREGLAAYVDAVRSDLGTAD